MAKFVSMVAMFLVKDFIVESDAPMIANFACYTEFDQSEFVGLVDFASYPTVRHG